MKTTPINSAHSIISESIPILSELNNISKIYIHNRIFERPFCNQGVLINHKRCVLYQNLISTYNVSHMENLVISAKSEHSNPLATGLYKLFAFVCFVFHGAAPIPYVQAAILNLPHP